jgi:hypothetical protein
MSFLLYIAGGGEGVTVESELIVGLQRRRNATAVTFSGGDLFHRCLLPRSPPREIC